MTGLYSQLSKRFFAWLASHKNTAYEKRVGPRKQALLGSLKGTIVEIGAGSGANFAYYPRGIDYIAVEPNTYMHRHLNEEAGRWNVTPDIRACTAEKIELDHSSADAVVGTLVLCSVTDPTVVVREIRRILKPGGTYYFIEHIAAPKRSVMRAIQYLVRPFWKLTNDGCRPDRETLEIIQNAGFAVVEAESFRVGAPVVSPHIAGRAVK